MHSRSIAKPIILATLVCGTLDILFAVLLTLWRGKEPAAMLRFVASGPFPQATDMGGTGSVLGLAVHFTLMAIMVAAFVLVARSRPSLLDQALLAALAFGLITYVAMNLIVVPLRFPAAWPPKPLGIGTQLFAHIVLVGLPTAYIARHFLHAGGIEPIRT
jgi:hypothetical protein